MTPFFRVLGWSYVGLCCAIAASALARRTARAHVNLATPPGQSASSDAAEWFRRVKPYCNAVEITVLQRQAPAPETLEGKGFHAACLALSGKIDDARRVIDDLPAALRYRAVGIVFDVAHPVADAGDDRSAAPIMEMVIDYWPNHYMALYHAGMAEYMLGQRALARRNLAEFLQQYHENDGWRSNGLEVLRRLNDSLTVEVDFRRPREPGAGQ